MPAGLLKTEQLLLEVLAAEDRAVHECIGFGEQRLDPGAKLAPYWSGASRLDFNHRSAGHLGLLFYSLCPLPSSFHFASYCTRSRTANI